MEFTALPGPQAYSDDPTVEDTLAGARCPRRCARRPRPAAAKPVPIVDVTMRLEEGPQYFVNRITFTGNTTTRDNVIRREMRLVEGGVFNTEALKYSVRRLNQLGYFKKLEGNEKDMKVDKTPGKTEHRRRHAEARGAEPQPADLRRRRVAVRGRASASSRSRRRTSWAAARA